jgi:hypothetical protein
MFFLSRSGIDWQARVYSDTKGGRRIQTTEVFKTSAVSLLTSLNEERCYGVAFSSCRLAASNRQ